MNPLFNWLELSRAQTQAAAETAHAMSACLGVMMDASAAFAKASVERNSDFAGKLMNAKSFESAAALQVAFLRDAAQASGAMAGKIADACAEAAKQCGAVATKSMEGLKPPSDRR